MAASTFSAISKDSEDGEVPKSVMDDIDDCDALGGFLDNTVLGHSMSGGLRLDRTHLRFSWNFSRLKVAKCQDFEIFWKPAMVCYKWEKIDFAEWNQDFRGQSILVRGPISLSR